MEIAIKRENTCCFTGHREIPVEMEEYLMGRITDGIRYLYSHNIKIFLTGGAIGFDSLAAKSVLKFRDTHADIQLIVIQPCKNQSKGWSHEHIEVYKLINSLADKVVCLSEHYYQHRRHHRQPCNPLHLRDGSAGVSLVRDCDPAGIALSFNSTRCLWIVFDFPRSLWYGSVCKDPTIL